MSKSNLSPYEVTVHLDSLWRDRQAYPNPCNYNVTTEQTLTWPRFPRDPRLLNKNFSGGLRDPAYIFNVKSFVFPYPRVELFATRNILVDVIDPIGFLNSPNHGLNNGDMLKTSLNWGGFERNREYYVINSLLNSFQLSFLPGGAPIPFPVGTGLNILLSFVTPEINALIIRAIKILEFPHLYLDIHTTRNQDIRLVRSINGILTHAKFVLSQDKYYYDERLTPLWIECTTNDIQVLRIAANFPLTISLLTRDGSIVDFFNDPVNNNITNPYRQTFLTFGITPIDPDSTPDGSN